MALPRPLTLALLASLVAAGGFGLWKVAEGQRDQAIRAALGRYERALRQGDASGLKAALAPKARQEFESKGGEAALPLLKGLQPESFQIMGIRFQTSDQAIAELGAPQGTGEAVLLQTDGLWQVDKVSWNLTFNLGSGGAPSAPSRPLSPQTKALLDRMAGSDPRDAGQAWLELGGKYDQASAFRRDLQAAFQDPRPIPFRIVYEENTYGKDTFRSYTTKLEPLDSGPSAAATVGEALRLDVWRMEGLGLRAGGPDPQAWWPGYARQHGLGAESSAPSAAPSGAQPSGSAFPFLDPKVPGSGEARIVFDGKPETFHLGTSFWTDTRMKDPTQAVLEFRIPQDSGNPRRIRLRFDATRTGTQMSDGARVDMLYIADGGQHFPPVDPCPIRVLRAYTGDTASLLKGEVPQVRIHSAGIDHTLAFTFEVRGSLQKTP